MSKYRKIVWNEGMLLTPHHFQQWDNYYEELLSSRLRTVMPYEYGVLDLQVNHEAVANGNFQITNCYAVLPDGLLINVPDTEAVPDMRPVGNHFHPEQEKLLAIMQSTANALVKIGKIKPVELSPNWLANDQPKPPEQRGMPHSTSALEQILTDYFNAKLDFIHFEN